MANNKRNCYKTVDSNMIRDLRIDAGVHGDTQLVETCEKALSGDDKSWEICADILRATMEEDDEIHN